MSNYARRIKEILDLSARLEDDIIAEERQLREVVIPEMESKLAQLREAGELTEEPTREVMRLQWNLAKMRGKRSYLDSPMRGYAMGMRLAAQIAIDTAVAGDKYYG